MMEDTSHQRTALLEVLAGVGATPFYLDGDAAVIGRDPVLDVVLDDPRVSRRHARVWVDARRLMIEDLGSRAGTVVNGRPIAGPTELRNGDHLRLGLTELTVAWNPGLADTLEMPAVGEDPEHGYLTYGELSARGDDPRDARNVAAYAPEVALAPTQARDPSRRGAGSELVANVADVAVNANNHRLPLWLRTMLGMTRGSRS